MSCKHYMLFDYSSSMTGEDVNSALEALKALSYDYNVIFFAETESKIYTKQEILNGASLPTINRNATNTYDALMTALSNCPADGQITIITDGDFNKNGAFFVELLSSTEEPRINYAFLSEDDKYYKEACRDKGKGNKSERENLLAVIHKNCHHYYLMAVYKTHGRHRNVEKGNKATENLITFLQSLETKISHFSYK